MIQKNSMMKQSSYYKSKNIRHRNSFTSSLLSGSTYSSKFNSSSFQNLDLSHGPQRILEEKLIFNEDWSQNQEASPHRVSAQRIPDSGDSKSTSLNRICSSKIYVTWPKNITVSSKMLSQAFCKQGAIIQCYVGKKTKQNQLPSFGFIRFKKLKSAISMISLKSLVYRNIPFKMDSVIERDLNKFDSYKKNRRRNKLDKNLKKKKNSTGFKPTKTEKHGKNYYSGFHVNEQDFSRQKNRSCFISSQQLMFELTLPFSANKRVIYAVQQHQQLKNNLQFSRDLRV